MEQFEHNGDRNISFQFSCQGGGLPASLIDSFYLCVAITAMILNGLVLTGLAHLSYSASSKRFMGIRRSFNRGHPRFMPKNMRYSKSVKTRRHHTSDKVDRTPFSGKKSSPKKMPCSGDRNEANIHRSPSCPDQLLYSHGHHENFNTEKSNYWLSQLNVGRKRSIRHSPQPKARLTTALHLVYSLIIADFLNAITTLMILLLSFWRPPGAFDTTHPDAIQIEAVEPCARLILSSLLYTAYNASLFSITGLMLDLYLGVVRPMRYRVLAKRTLFRWIFGGWAVAIFLGCSQFFFPKFLRTDKNTPIFRRFLLPSEPCYILPRPARQDFCLFYGSANLFRSGFLTGGVLLLCATVMNVLCGISFHKVRKNLLTRSLTLRLANARRSASLPTINRINSVAFSLHALRTAHFTAPNSTPRCTGRKLLRSSFALLCLIALFAAFFVPSLALDVFFIFTGRPSNLAAWIYELVTNMPVCVALLNPVVYSLRLNDINVGLQNFKKRLMSHTDKGFMQRQLRFRREQILVSTKLKAHLRIKLPPKDADATTYEVNPLRPIK